MAPIPADERGDLVTAYGRRLSDPDRSVRVTTAQAWSRWEASLVTLEPDPVLLAAFAEPDQLLRDIDRIRHIPGVIVHGRHDMCTPAANAWALHKAWPEADLHLVEAAGHAYDEPACWSSCWRRPTASGRDRHQPEQARDGHGQLDGLTGPVVARPQPLHRPQAVRGQGQRTAHHLRRANRAS